MHCSRRFPPLARSLSPPKGQTHENSHNMPHCQNAITNSRTWETTLYPNLHRLAKKLTRIPCKGGEGRAGPALGQGGVSELPPGDGGSRCGGSAAQGRQSGSGGHFELKIKAKSRGAKRWGQEVYQQQSDTDNTSSTLLPDRLTVLLHVECWVSVVVNPLVG